MYRYLNIDDLALLVDYYTKRNKAIPIERLRDNLNKGVYFAKVEDEILGFVIFKGRRNTMGVYHFLGEAFDIYLLLKEYENYKNITLFGCNEDEKNFYLKNNFLLQDTLIDYRLCKYDKVEPSNKDIKRLTSDYLEEIYTINYKAFGEFWAQDKDELINTFKEVGEHKNIKGVFVKENLAGYITYNTTGPIGHIARLAIKPSMQGEGLGKALLNTALLHMKEANIEEVKLYTQINNESSRPLYERRGFVPNNIEYVLRY